MFWYVRRVIKSPLTTVLQKRLAVSYDASLSKSFWRKYRLQSKELEKGAGATQLLVGLIHRKLNGSEVWTKRFAARIVQNPDFQLKVGVFVFYEDKFIFSIKISLQFSL
jgi:hypothetical protein